MHSRYNSPALFWGGCFSLLYRHLDTPLYTLFLPHPHFPCPDPYHRHDTSLPLTQITIQLQQEQIIHVSPSHVVELV